ncbi:MAG TPA: hypothetical protein VJS63_07980 [Bradyrhizobium sp.]|nr:hypothetical protein [Bradyrhizobium sp.]
MAEPLSGRASRPAGQSGSHRRHRQTVRGFRPSAILSAVSNDPHSNRPAMTDDGDKGERQTAVPEKHSRQDRLKQALRENLRRRKSQARARGETAGGSSECHDATLDEASGKGTDG